MCRVFRDGKFFKDWSKNILFTVVMKSGVSNSCLALGLPVPFAEKMFGQFILGIH